MTEKSFFEVFPSLNLKGTLLDKLKNVVITRVSATKNRDRMTVYIKSTVLIFKAEIREIEKEIKKQLFPKNGIEIHLIESFTLSGQYTPENVMNVYKDSILLELEEYNHILYNAFRKSEIAFPAPNVMKLTTEDTVLYRGMEKELIRVLEKVMVERFGFTLEIRMDYAEAVTGKFAVEDEMKLRLKVDEIYRRVNRKKDSFAGEETGDEAAGGQVAENSGTAKKSRGDSRKSDFKKGNKPAPERGLKKSDHPDLICGREFDEDPIAIEEIVGEMGVVVIRGKILKVDKREVRNEKFLVMFDITDFTDTITVKIFVPGTSVDEFMKDIPEGSFVKLKGIVSVDPYDHEMTINPVQGMMKTVDTTEKRKDLAAYKRVELHCHTKMSDMDGVSEAKNIVKRAFQWGHRAIAITDHGAVQGFTDAYHTWEDLWKAEKKKKSAAGEQPNQQDFFKIIYGVEGYLVDDSKEIVTGDRGQSLDSDFVVFDIETTGFSPIKDKIIEIGAVKVSKGEVVDRFSTFVDPHIPIPYEIEQLTGIRDDMVMGAPDIDEVLPEFRDFCEGCIYVAHNAGFDMSFILERYRQKGISTDVTYVDTMNLSRMLLQGQAKHTLDAVAKTLKIPLDSHHRAVDDAECTSKIFMRFIRMLAEDDVTTLTQVNDRGAMSIDLIHRLPSNHIVILAKNDLEESISIDWCQNPI